MDELKRKAARYIRSGDLVLLKGSRGCALEQLTDTLLSIARQDQDCAEVKTSPRTNCVAENAGFEAAEGRF
jgi:hypothetical protein